ncbi:hypothetical protein CKAN_02270900 [Cinnamomum micranthum f. kanehirae]|uniref:Uncharacterized protein n=1 Tax=Cinnamomum micranthum f. kanehirae TaxID=337451 RepID=A0A443PRR5_9MAGN|nr:hypothetical protein CKAN_02270900 [Cinnamomum micranthum f. kanehirae]
MGFETTNRLLSCRGWAVGVGRRPWRRIAGRGHWTVLLFPGPGARILLEPDFGISSLVLVRTYTSGDAYLYEEQAGEEIPEDLQPVEEAREWRADDVE